MSWVAAGVVGGATALTGMWGSSKAAGAQESAQKAAINAQKPFYQSGLKANEAINAMMGFDPTRMEKKRWAKDIKNELKLGGNWKSLTKEGRNAAIKAEMDKQLAERSGKDTYGFLNKRFGMDTFEQEPGYNFRRQEGENSINRGLAARGGLLSGAAMKALSRYNQDFASNEYTNAYNRYSADQANTYNRLASLAGTGQVAANQIGQYRSNIGDAQAAGYMGAANALSSGIGAGASMYGMRAGGGGIPMAGMPNNLAGNIG